MPTKPCWQSSTTISSSSLVRVEQGRLRPPRRFCSITPSAVRARLCSTLSGTKCSCPTPSSRSDGYLYHHTEICKKVCHTCGAQTYFCFSAGFRQCQNTEKWQLKSIWEVHGHSVWRTGKKRDKFPKALWSGTLAYSVCYRTAMTWLIHEVWSNGWFIKTIAHSKNKKQTKNICSN